MSHAPGRLFNLLLLTCCALLLSACSSSLDEDQVAALFDNLAERNRELREKHLAPPLAEQVKNRAERLKDRLERWFGELSNEQRQLISAWAQQRGAQNKAWLAGREQWQAALADTLRARHEPGFERRVYALLNDPGRFRTAEYNSAMEIGRGQSVDLTQRLLAVSSERQLAHVLDELESLSADLQALSCPAS